MQRRDRRPHHLVDRGLEEVGGPLVAESHPVVVEADQQHRHRRGREQLPEVLLALFQLAGALQDQPLEPQPILVRAPLVGGDEGPELRDRVVHQEGEDVGGVAAVVAVDLHREVTGGDPHQGVGQMGHGAREPILPLPRGPQHPLELLGDGVEEERRRVVAIARHRARQAIAELALAQAEEAFDQRRRQRVRG